MLPNAQGVPKSGFQLVLGQSLVSIGLKSHLTLYDHQLDCSSHTAFSPTHSYTTCLISCNSFHFTWTHQLTFMLDVGWLCSVLRPRQHSIGYMGDGFYRPTSEKQHSRLKADNAISSRRQCRYSCVVPKRM